MAECYKEAVWADLTCIRAVTSLTSHQMLTLDEVSRPSLARSCPMVTGDIHVVLLVELKKTINLFRLSHSPVGLFPKWCVAWYAIGGCIAV